MNSGVAELAKSFGRIANWAESLRDFRYGNPRLSV